MKKAYQTPLLDYVRFETEDVLEDSALLIINPTQKEVSNPVEMGKVTLDW